MTTAPPAGWYLDPADPAQERWWDGTQWHSASRPVPEQAPPRLPPPEPLPPPPPPTVAPRPPGLWVAIGAIALMVIGAVAPWGTALRVVQVSGTRGGDGWLVMGAALVAAVVLIVTRNSAGPVVGIVCGAFGLLIGFVDLSDIESKGPLVQPSWGIYLVLIGSAALVIASVVMLTAARHRTR